LQCIPGRIQHLLAAVPPHLSRPFAKEHDDAIFTAVAETLDLGVLTARDKLLMQRKISKHGLGLRSMERNTDFLFLSGFMRSIKIIKRTFPNFAHVLQHTLDGDSGIGRELADCLTVLQEGASEKLWGLLPHTLEEAALDTYTWKHDEIQRELDNMVIVEHQRTFDLARIPDQQDLANLMATDTSIFQLIPRSALFRIPNDTLIYIAKQLFGKPQRRHQHKYCPNIAESTGRFCGAPLDSRDIHLRTCRMNNVNHVKHEALKHWFQDLTKQAHVQTAPAPPISETSQRHPTKPLAGDLMLIGVSLRESGRDGRSGVIDFSIVTPAAESYCAESATQPLHAAKLREEHKIRKYLQAYKELDDIHFEPFVIESGGALGKRAQEIFRKISDLISQATGQSLSSIAYFWKARLLVTLAKITHSNALRWAMAHNKPDDPDSIVVRETEEYEYDAYVTRQMLHSSGIDSIVRGSPL
jgi:hypothetical protein